jgi:hypothetical protein
MGTPANRFYGGGMLAELDQGLVTVERPYHQFVVISARSQLLVVEAPLQPAHLLLVTLHFTVRIALGP